MVNLLISDMVDGGGYVVLSLFLTESIEKKSFLLDGSSVNGCSSL